MCPLRAVRLLMGISDVEIVETGITGAWGRRSVADEEGILGVGLPPQQTKQTPTAPTSQMIVEANDKRGDNSDRVVLNPNGKRERKENTTDTTTDHDYGLTNDVVANTKNDGHSQSHEPRTKRPKTLDKKAKTIGTQQKANSAHPNVTKAAGTKEKVSTQAEVQAFLDNVKNLTDWTSTSVKPRYIALARWHDFDGLSMKQCAQKWVADGYGVAKPMKEKKGEKKGGKKDGSGIPQVSEAAMYKNYNRYAKQFYEDKGIAFVPPKARKFPYGNKKPVTSHHTASSKHREEDAEEVEDEEDQVDTPYPEWMEKSATPSLPLDDQDPMAFSAHSGNASLPPELQKKSKEMVRKAPKLAPEDKKLASLLSSSKTKSKPEKHLIHLDKMRTASSPDSHEPETEAGDRDAEIELFKIHRASKNGLRFEREAGDVDRSHPTRPVLNRALAIQHSGFLRGEQMVILDINTIEYGEDIDESTVTRYIACISPRLRSSLPTYDVVELKTDRDDDRFRATPTEWSMQEIEDLYMFAHTMGTPDVCDMVMDRVYEELHRPGQRSTRDKYGRKKRLSVLNFSPGFLNYLHQFDVRGFELFADILVTKGRDALVAMSAAGLSNWHHDVKLALEDKLESGKGPAVSEQNGTLICSMYHHHSCSTDQCYRAKTSNPRLTCASVPRDTSVSKPIRQTNRSEAFAHKARHAHEERMSRWSRRRAYHQNLRKANKARMRRPSTPEKIEADSRPQTRLEDKYDEGDGEYIESASSSDSSEDEDGNAITVRLNSGYAKSRDLFRNAIEKYEALEVYAQPSESGQSGKWIKGRSGPNEDATTHHVEDINLVKDSERAALEKYTIVQEKLQMFRKYDYDMDGLRAPTPSTTLEEQIGE
ncbi:hypothetical protein TW65_07253 [Stemphylium lycopersici]|nr:hypothetical protein TW65_07253 [Stemphylium lycopersici]